MGQKIDFHIADFIIYFLFAISIVLSFFFLLPLSGNTLSVEADGKKYSFSLSDEGLHTVRGPLGDTIIEIKERRARVVSSPCPNKTCVRAGWSKTIVCLPNKVVASVKETRVGEVDAVAS